MISHVTAVVLFVEDFETSLAFYRDKVGLQVVQLEPTFAAFKMRDQDFAINHIAEAAAMVNVKPTAFESQTGQAKRVMLCARVENVDTAYATLKANGVEFTRPPIDQPWGLRAIYFSDPEGNIWEFAHPLTAQ